MTTGLALQKSYVVLAVSFFQYYVPVTLFTIISAFFVPAPELR
jgi:hypothetical protein